MKPSTHICSTKGLNSAIFSFARTLFQSWISSQIEEPIEQMAKFLYRTAADEYALNIHLSPAERYAVIFWWTGLKAELATRYNELFRRIPAGAEDYDDSSPAERQRESTDAQIRALTAGDITKEPAVLKTETHRALTELNAKAREARITMQKWEHEDLSEPNAEGSSCSGGQRYLCHSGTWNGGKVWCKPRFCSTPFNPCQDAPRQSWRPMRFEP